MIDDATPLPRNGDGDDPAHGDRNRDTKRTARSSSVRVSAVGSRSRNDIFDVEAAARSSLGHELDEASATEPPAQEEDPHRTMQGQPDHDPRGGEVNKEG